MSADELPSKPSLAWRTGSMLVCGVSGLICRGFMLGFNRMEVNGGEKFQELLDERADVDGRTRGLITVSNHLSVLDDPLVWGALPWRYHFNQDNTRWSLASHDIVSTARMFELGNTLPAHRMAHSKFGGLFQPTMTQAIRLLSNGPFAAPSSHPSPVSPGPDLVDPFTNGALTYSTNGEDSFQAPSAYGTRRHAWVHIFPEGKIHQKEDYTMRYFRWGVSRLILESEPCPDLVPMWIEGMDQVMHESRTFPRPVPRIGNFISITFGDKVDMESTFGDLREKWRQLHDRVRREKGAQAAEEVGILRDDELKYGEEAVALRKECTLRVRQEVLKLRRQRGWPDEDPKSSLVETWKQEGGKKEGLMNDGSWVKDT
ncbi:hypothetical protein MBLNU457_4893t1 [Dothideomycetes sp. NU457]